MYLSFPYIYSVCSHLLTVAKATGFRRLLSVLSVVLLIWNQFCLKFQPVSLEVFLVKYNIIRLI